MVSLQGLIIITWGVGRGGDVDEILISFNFDSFGCCISYKNAGKIGTKTKSKKFLSIVK